MAGVKKCTGHQPTDSRDTVVVNWQDALKGTFHVLSTTGASKGAILLHYFNMFVHVHYASLRWTLHEFYKQSAIWLQSRLPPLWSPLQKRLIEPSFVPAENCRTGVISLSWCEIYRHRCMRYKCDSLNMLMQAFVILSTSGFWIYAHSGSVLTLFFLPFFKACVMGLNTSRADLRRQF